MSLLVEPFSISSSVVNALSFFLRLRISSDIFLVLASYSAILPALSISFILSSSLIICCMTLRICDSLIFLSLIIFSIAFGLPPIPLTPLPLNIYLNSSSVMLGSLISSLYLIFNMFSELASICLAFSSDETGLYFMFV